MKKVPKLFVVVVVVVWAKGVGLKKCLEKSVLYVLQNFHTKLKSRGQQEEKKININSQTAAPGPSVVEEEDLEDLHHHGDV